MSSLFQILRVSRGGRIGLTGLSAWRPDLKVWHRLFVPLLQVARLVTGKLTRSRVIQCAHFARYCSRLYGYQGPKGLVLHLKVAHVMLMKALPGARSDSSSRAIGKVAVSTASGLPRLIPKFARILIRKGDLSTIRLWLSLLGLYRVINFTGVASVSTITDPGVDLSPDFVKGWSTFVRSWFLPQLSRMIGLRLLDRDPEKDLHPEPLALSSAASNSKYGTSSLGTAEFSARLWLLGFGGSSLLDYLYFLGQVEGTKSMVTLMERVACPPSVIRETKFQNGRLHFIPEPAGKVRVVALVDYWTQVALYPIHRFLFDIFRDIDQDGTHDQLKPVKALLKGVSKDQTIYSYDLSAATDRLPILVQQIILGHIWSPYFSAAWKELLVGRSYSVPRPEEGKVSTLPSSVKYAVGQPMGAYSSWAMLALTHHAIVQYAAYQCNHTEWFTKYAVLGDDIVIADDAVARAYLMLCGRLGVKVGIAKSLVASGHTLEFAKRTFFRTKDVSGLPWKLFAVSQRHLSVAVALLARLGGQGVSLGPAGTLLGLGGNWKSACTSGCSWEKISQRSKALLVTASHPNAGSPFSFPSWVHWLSSRGPSLSGVPVDATSTWFTPWATGLLTEYLSPLVEKASDIHNAFLWDPPVAMGPPPSVKSGGGGPLWSADTLGEGVLYLHRLLDAKASGKLVAAEDALEKSTKSLQHLQSLNIKFMFHQASAVFTQVVNLCEDRLSAIPKPARELMFQALGPERPPVLRTLSTWIRWRRRAFTPKP